jgi:hypothetical protein
MKHLQGRNMNFCLKIIGAENCLAAGRGTYTINPDYSLSKS